MVDKDGMIPLGSVARNITLPPVLSNLSLYVKTGEKVAIVGPSVEKKTNLAKLLS